MNYPQITVQVEQYVTSRFAAQGDNQLLYHDISHTKSVVATASRIAVHYELNDLDLFIVVVAAWFHDLGYYMAGAAGLHELKGAGLADFFLTEKEVDEAAIAKIKNCILATKMPQHPLTLNEQIVCDADLFHLGTDQFSKCNKRLRKEYEATGNTRISKDEWRKETIRLLTTHRYHTDYCRSLLNQKKQENLEKLLQNEKDDMLQPVVAGVHEQLTGDDPATKKKTTLKEDKKPLKGIETMFRITIANQQRLSHMADKKAAIMISVNSIIISVVIGLVVRKLEPATGLIIPILILLAGCMIAVIFSVLATRPKIPGGYFSPEQLSAKKVNLLFFGNFYNMDYEHYYKGMQMVMADSEFLYASLIRDIYSQGIVLGNKYKLLRISYTVFMFTLIITILAFCVAFL